MDLSPFGKYILNFQVSEVSSFTNIRWEALCLEACDLSGPCQDWLCKISLLRWVSHRHVAWQCQEHQKSPAVHFWKDGRLPGSKPAGAAPSEGKVSFYTGLSEQDIDEDFDYIEKQGPQTYHSNTQLRWIQSSSLVKIVQFIIGQSVWLKRLCGIWWTTVFLPYLSMTFPWHGLTWGLVFWSFWRIFSPPSLTRP